MAGVLVLVVAMGDVRYCQADEQDVSWHGDTLALPPPISCVISLSCDVDVSKTWAIKQMFGLTNNRALNLTIVPTSASFIMDTDTSLRRM